MSVRLFRRGLPTAALAALALALAGLPAAAEAASVHVEERIAQVDGWTRLSPNEATLVFAASAAEHNQVSVTRVAHGTEFDQLLVVDSGAPLTAGPGCTGGGPPGEPVTCTIHAPALGVVCSKACEPPRSETMGWGPKIKVDLGDGNNSFDGSTLTGNTLYTYAEVVVAGSGDDRILTGSGSDEVDPGTGYDEVHTNDGSDRVRTSPVPDGPDVYDLGAGISQAISYEQRTTPVELSPSSGGAPGENDSLSGVTYLVGGSANDVLRGSGQPVALVGGPGDDRIVGGPRGELLDGGPGEDSLFGGAGGDNVFGREDDDLLVGGPGDDRFEGSDGDDLARGEAGHDIFLLGAGDDVGLGGSDPDWIFGEAGDDRLHGGEGGDLVAGEAGRDRLWGGRGGDTLRAGRTNEHVESSRLEPVDTASDRVDCGRGIDEARKNPWDTSANCEWQHSVDAVTFGTPRRDLAAGTARLPLIVGSAGDLKLYGRGVTPLELRVDRPYGKKRPLLFNVQAGGGALAQLKARGRVELQVVARFAPDGGSPRNASAVVVLKTAS